MTASSAVAVLAVAAIVLLRTRSLAPLRIASIGGSRGAPRSAVGPAAGRLRGPLIVASIVALAGLGVRMVFILGSALLLYTLGRRTAARSRLRRARQRRRRVVLALCDGLSGELRAGLPMALALRKACGAEGELEPVVSAAELGGDVGGTLRGCAGRPGAEGLRAVAAAFEVAGSSGSSLANVLDRLAAGLREDEDARAEVLAALGPPRATAKMLALLPGFGLLLGSSIGAEPVTFLLGTPWGLGCLVGGIGLALLGLWWVERLADAAEG